MMHHLEINNILATHDWANTLNSGGQTDVLFLDFTKAFDSVPHTRLLNKLKYYDISGKMNGWIEGVLD